MSNDVQKTTLNSSLATDLKIAIVIADFNEQYTKGLLWGAKKTFSDLNGNDVNLKVYHVPGVVEIPLTCQKLADINNDLDGIVALGVVLKGDTSHFDYVCQMTSQGIMHVMLECDVSIGFGVITADKEEHIIARTSEDEKNKGKEAMLATIKMCQLSNQINTQQ